MSGDSQQSQSQSREPWAPAQPWLRQNLQTGQNLQNYYQQNPFNSIQQTSMQNMLGDIDNFRSNINPGMMAFANRLMNSSYSRNGGNSSRGGGYGGGYGGGMGGQGAMPQGGGDAGGLLGGMFDAQMAARGAPRETMGDIDHFIAAATGTLGPNASMAAGMQNQSGSRDPFRANPGQMYGLLDWAELNPYTATNGVRPPAPPPAEDAAAARQRETEEEALRRYMESERRSAGA